MLSNIGVGKYFPANSNIHKMHPLSKIICTVLFIIILLVARDVQITAALTLLVMIMMMNTNIPLTVYYQSIKNIKILLLIIFIIAGLISLSIISAFIVLIDCLLIILYTTILTLTTPPTEITYGLEKFLFPLNYIKVPVNKVALNISLALRFIPTVIDQSDKILKSEASRGVDNRSSIKKWFMATIFMIGPAIVLSLKTFKQLKSMMKLRLFGTYDTRTNFRINKWSLFDSYLVIIHVAIFVAIILRGVIM